MGALLSGSWTARRVWGVFCFYQHEPVSWHSHFYQELCDLAISDAPAQPEMCDCITLQTPGWVDAPKHAEHAAYAPLSHGAVPPNRMRFSLFLTQCHWEVSLSLSLTFHPLSLSVPQCLSSLWSGGSGALCLALFPGCFLLCETGQSGTTGIIAALSSHPAGFRYISILFFISLFLSPHIPHVPVIYPLWIRNACLLPTVLIYFKQGNITNVE